MKMILVAQSSGVKDLQRTLLKQFPKLDGRLFFTDTFHDAYKMMKEVKFDALITGNTFTDGLNSTEAGVTNFFTDKSGEMQEKNGPLLGKLAKEINPLMEIYLYSYDGGNFSRAIFTDLIDKDIKADHRKVKDGLDDLLGKLQEQ